MDKPTTARVLMITPRQNRHRLQHRNSSPTGNTNWNLKRPSPAAIPALSSHPLLSIQRDTTKHSNNRNESWPSVSTKYNGRNSTKNPAQIVGMAAHGNIERRIQAQAAITNTLTRAKQR